MMKKPFTVKPKVTKKKRIENAPHWTHAGTIAARRRALDDIQTTRHFNDEIRAHRLAERADNIDSELRRLDSMRDLRRPANQFYADRRDNLMQALTQARANVRALRQRPTIVR